MSTGAAIGGGLARGLANVLFANRQRDEQKRLADEQRQHSTRLMLFGKALEEGVNPDEAMQTLGLDLNFGEKPPKGAPDPNQVVSDLLSQVGGGQPLVGTGEDTSFVRDAIGGVADKAKAATTPKQHTFLGQPVLTREEKAEEATTNSVRTLEATRTAQIDMARRILPELQKVDPGLGIKDALEYVSTGRMDAVRQFTPTAVGRAVAANDLTGQPGLVGPNGEPVDLKQAEWWQPVRGKTGELYYIPGQAPAGNKSGLGALTGEAQQVSQMNALMSGIDPATNKPFEDPEERDRAIKIGQTMLRDRQLKTQNTIVRIENGERTKDNIEELAQEMAANRLVPSLVPGYGQTRASVMASANRIRKEQGLPPLDFSKMQLEFYGAQRAVSSLNSPQALRLQQLGSTVVSTIDEVKRLAGDLQQGGVQKFNAAKRGSILEVYGNTPQSATAAKYLAAVNTLKEEFANLANGGYAPTEAAWKLANDQINGDYGAKDLLASIDEVQRLIQYRLNARQQMEDAVLGRTGPGSVVWETGPDGSLRRKQ